MYTTAISETKSTLEATTFKDMLSEVESHRSSVAKLHSERKSNKLKILPTTLDLKKLKYADSEQTPHEIKPKRPTRRI